MEALAQILDFSDPTLTGVILVFMRVAAISALLPGFGEQSIPARVRLLIAIAFTAIVWPLVSPLFVFSVDEIPVLIIIEITIGTLIGISIRLVVLALQLAGSIAAQSTSVSQIAGVSATPDPMPAIGNLLVISGLALVLVSGLHVKAAISMVNSYEVLPPGVLPIAGDVAEWGTARVAASFALALSLAAPFVVASFAYNAGLGAINRAMPALMVAFIGAPAITAGAILMLVMAAPALLTYWNGHMDVVLANPLGLP